MEHRLTHETEAGRRGAIDVARLGALLLVVVGHLSLAVIDRDPAGRLRGANLIALHPGLAWIAMLAPMPVFFAAAGWSNATSTPTSTARRLGRLVGLGAVVVTLWSIASMVELVVGGDSDIVADGARIATQPLWFLAAYVPFSAGGRLLSQFARRPVVAVVGCLIGLAVLDAARFAWGLPSAVGWPGFFLAWGIPWLIGAAWRRYHEVGGTGEQRIGVLMAVGGSVASVVLVTVADYFPSMIDAVAGKRSNTTPPTLFTATAAIAQVGLLIATAPLLDRLANRQRSATNRLGELAAGTYVWHLTALSLCAALFVAGLWAPERFTPAWWLSRPLWFGAVIATTLAFVDATRRVDEIGHRRQGRHRSATAQRRWIGLILATTGAAVVGLWGPRTIAGAVGSTGGFLGGWYCLTSHRTIGGAHSIDD